MLEVPSLRVDYYYYYYYYYYYFAFQTCHHGCAVSPPGLWVPTLSWALDLLQRYGSQISLHIDHYT